MPFFYVLFCRARQLKQVNSLCSLVQNHNVWSLASDTDFWGDGAAPCSLVSLQVTVDSIQTGVNTRDCIIDDTVMPPLPPTSVETNTAVIQHVVGGLPASAEFAEVRRRLLPTFEVGGGGEGVDSGVEQELEGAGLEVVHVALPHSVLFLSIGCTSWQPCPFLDILVRLQI